MSFIPRKSTLLKITFAITFISFLVHCKKENEIAPNNAANVNDAGKKDALKIAEAAKPEIKYSSFIFPSKKKDSAMEVFNKEFSNDEQYVILALNRLDIKNKWRADTLAIPDKIDETLMSYSPFPTRLEVLKEVNKMVLFSYPIQAYALYEKGNLVKWGPTSMGSKKAQTKRGLMFANWKKELAISTVNKSWKLPYNFNIHNSLGIGWHQYDLPGYPASHSCLRLLMDDAKYLYKWADQWVLNKGGATLKANGTPVIVFGDYQWGGKKPWKNLIENPKANDISIENLTEIIQPNLSKILEEQKNSDEVRAQKNAESTSEKTAA